MDAVIGRFNAHLFAIYRIVFGLLFFMHGAQKLLGWPPRPAGMGGGKMPPIAHIGGYIELICGFLVMIGLFGGLAAFLASGEMAVAYFMAHAPRGPYPIVNQGEAAVLYCFAFLYIAAHGSGIWSIDNILRHRGAPTATASTAATQP